MMVKAVVLFPEPDSPTRPNVSPALMEKLTSSTALTVPMEVLKCFFRLFTTSISSAMSFHILEEEACDLMILPLVPEGRDLLVAVRADDYNCFKHQKGKCL